VKFFERQEDARKRTARLRIAFALTVLVVVVLLDFVLLIALGGRTHGIARAFARNPAFFAGLSTFVALPILYSSWKKWRELQQGGAAVARSLGALPVTPANRDPGSVRLRNVVEEMSLAARIPTPALFVLREERGINAFAAGLSTEDAAVVVTQGTLDSLDRAELQAVLGHEFSHVLNGDMAMNLRMTAWLHGLYSLTHLGERIRQNKKGKTRGARSWLIGWLVTICGLIGHGAGRVLQAAVSRSREQLADASAVQFTRDPEALKGALLKIAGTTAGSRVEAAGAVGVAHMFFASGMRMHTWKFAESMLATHPSIPERLKAIDPSFDERALGRLAREAANKARERAAAAREAVAELDPAKKPPDDAAARAERLVAVATTAVTLAGAAGGSTKAARAVPAATPAPTGPDAPSPVGTRRGTAAVDPVAAPGAVARPATAAAARTQIAPFPPPVKGDGASVRTLEALRQAAQTDGNAIALVLAVIIAEEPARRARHVKAIGTAFGAKVAVDVERFATQVDASVPRGRFLAIQRVLEVVRAMPEAERMRLGRAVRKLAADDPSPSVFRACFVELVTARCEPPADAPVSLRDSLPAFATLLAVLARAGTTDERAQRRAYEAGLTGLVPGVTPPFVLPDDWLAGLSTGFGAVLRAHPGARRLLRDALGRTVLADGRVTAEESDIARAACVLMDVPPPNFGQANSLTAAPGAATARS
jgi:Zn-dependent protease with chaperone function